VSGYLNSTAATYAVDESGAAEFLVERLDRDRRGVPTNAVAVRLYLIGMLLSLMERSSATVTNIWAALDGLDVDQKLAIGFHAKRHGRDWIGGPVINIHHIYNVNKSLWHQLEYGPGAMPDLDPERRAARHRAVLELCDRLLDVTLVGTANVMAIDATSVEAYGKRPWGKSPQGVPDMDEPLDTLDDRPSGEVTTPEVDDSDRDAMGRKRRRRRAVTDPDARWGGKTAKDGTKEWFYGYYEHAMVQTGSDDPAGGHPPLVVRLEVTTAHPGLAIPAALDLIDRSPHRIKEVLVDRFYPYAIVENWADPLRQRGIRQTFDLRADQQHFIPYKGMLFIAGQAHCPCIPKKLESIPALGFAPTAEERETFQARIAERAQYAMRVKEHIDVEGSIRLQCPAVAGKIGCPLRPETVPGAIEKGHLVLEKPEGHVNVKKLPDCCTKDTFTVTLPDPIRKLHQHLTWGSAKWRKAYDKRTYVESSFGSRKHPNTENMKRPGSYGGLVA